MASVHIATNDLKSACRQVPSQVFIAITIVHDPDRDAVGYHEFYVQPFWAGNAAPKLYWFASFVCQISRRFLFLSIKYFCDDFFIVEPSCSATHTDECFARWCEAMGVELDADKNQKASQQATVLEVMLDLGYLHESHIIVAPKLSRIQNLMSRCFEILLRNNLSPSQTAGRLRGLNALRQCGKRLFFSSQSLTIPMQGAI